MRISITLFDFSDPENPLEPLSVEMEYTEPHPEGLEFGPKKVTIGVGDNVACGTTTIPLTCLTDLMMQLMHADRQRASSALVGFAPPPIIIPN